MALETLKLNHGTTTKSHSMCTEREIEGKKQSLSEERAHSPFHEIESK